MGRVTVPCAARCTMPGQMRDAHTPASLTLMILLGSECHDTDVKNNKHIEGCLALPAGCTSRVLITGESLAAQVQSRKCTQRKFTHRSFRPPCRSKAPVADIFRSIRRVGVLDLPRRPKLVPNLPLLVRALFWTLLPTSPDIFLP